MEGASIKREPVAARQRMDPAATNAARTLFLNRCAKCHALPQVGRYTTAQWERIIPKMAKRSGLKPEQKAALLAYLVSAKGNTR